MNNIFVCPSLRRDCTWEGDITEIGTHFEDFHLDLLLTDHNNITLDNKSQPLNRILIYQSELYLIQTEWQSETGLLILRVRQPRPTNGIKYHLNVRNLKNVNYLFSSKVAEDGYNTVKINDGSIEIDIGTIKLIVGNGEIIGGLEFEQQVVRRPDSVLQLMNRGSSLSRADSLNMNFMRRLFRTCSEYIEEPEDLGRCEDGLEDDIDITDPLKYKDYVQAYIEFMRKRRSRLSVRSLNIEEDEEDDSTIIEESEEDIKKREYEEQEKKEQEEYQTNLTKIQCSNCSRLMNPPIFVCFNGHSVCFYCQGDICHKCGARITDLSNSDLEEISKSIPHPCRFSKQGCTRSIDYCKVHVHEIRCEHHFYTCPDMVICSKAPFQIKYGEMISHIRIMHPSVPVVNESRNVRFVKGSEFFLVNDEVGIFYCRARGMDGNSLEFNVYFCGARDTYFFCHLQIEIKGKRGEDTFYLTRRGNLWCRTMTYREMRDRKLKEKTIKLHILAH